MPVKRKGCYNTQPFHNRKSSAIGKAEHLILIALKDLPGCRPVFRGYRNKMSQGLTKELLSYFHSPSVAQTNAHQSQGFIYNIVGGEKRRVVYLLEMLSRFVFAVVLIEQGIPRAGVNTYKVSEQLPVLCVEVFVVIDAAIR